MPKNGAKSLRSRSCDLTSIVDQHLKLNDSTSTDVSELNTIHSELEAIQEEKNSEGPDSEKDLKDENKYIDEQKIGSQEDGISENIR